MANLKNMLLKTIKNNSDFDKTLEELSNVQSNILKNYENPVFNSKDKNKLLNRYSVLENIGKSLFRYKSLLDNDLEADNEEVSNMVLKGGISNTRYIWQSENGEHTCEKCKALDGTIYNFEDEVPERPHPNCKCTVKILEDKADEKNESECDCYELAAIILSDVNDMDEEASSVISEINEAIEEIESDFEEYKQLYEEVQSLQEDVENIEICGENCVAITGFAIDLNNDADLEEKFYEIIKYSKSASETYRIFQHNKKLMEEEAQHLDKYYHAKANCESAELGNLHALAAIAFSILKEIKDFLNKVFVLKKDYKVIYKDCMEDLKADFLGLMKAYEHGYCGEKVIEVEDIFKHK